MNLHFWGPLFPTPPPLLALRPPPADSGKPGGEMGVYSSRLDLLPHRDKTTIGGLSAPHILFHAQHRRSLSALTWRPFSAPAAQAVEPGRQPPARAGRAHPGQARRAAIQRKSLRIFMRSCQVDYVPDCQPQQIEDLRLEHCRFIGTGQTPQFGFFKTLTSPHVRLQGPAQGPGLAFCEGDLA